jgi:hypothetical protein
MSCESRPVLPLEQRCVRPGYWVIEGWDVRRQAVSNPYYGYWAARRPGEDFQRRTLALIREEIRNRMEG